MSLPALVWRTSPNFSQRTARVDLIVLHDTEGGYSGSVAWFSQARSNVSIHYVVREDGLEATQMVHLADKAWHAMAFNSRSVGIEMAGFAKNGFPRAQLLASAEMVAWLCAHLQIPVKHARGGVGPGIESHYGLGYAGGGHTDPSTDPKFMDEFIALVSQAYAQHDFPVVWEAPGKTSLCGLAPPAPTQWSYSGQIKVPLVPVPTL